jgi:hypothetical protein
MPKTCMILIPAHGRDYQSKAAVELDLKADKDFIVADSRKPVNLSQLRQAGFTTVPVRYAALRKITWITI